MTDANKVPAAAIKRVVRTPRLSPNSPPSNDPIRVAPNAAKRRVAFTRPSILSEMIS